MSMKRSTDPRTVYSRSGNLIVLFDGKRFAKPAEGSKFEVGEDVTIEKAKSDGGRARVIVSSLEGNRKEVWRSQKTA